MILYGIKNCGTVKKSINWLNSNNIPFDFHDYKNKGISVKKLQEWSNQVGIDSLINKKGMTWKKLDERDKELMQNDNKALEIISANASLIRRPIIEQGGKIITIGFDEKAFSEKYQLNQ